MFLINILLVDDHILFAKSLEIALEEYDEIEDFYSVQDVHALTQTIRDRKTDIVLMDINLGKSNEIDGLKAAKDLLENIPDIKIEKKRNCAGIVYKRKNLIQPPAAHI